MAVTQEAPARSKQQDLYGKPHMGMDHVLAKLLLNAPPLPDALKLQTEAQSLSTTWVQVSEAYEKRRAMLQRRKEKGKAKTKLRARRRARIIRKKRRRRRRRN